MSLTQDKRVSGRISHLESGIWMGGRGIAIHAIRNYNTLGTPFMTRQRMRKVTYSLPEDLLEGVRSVVRGGAAPSFSAFVQRALADGVDRAREALLAEAFLNASRDPKFLEDVDRSLRAFGNSEDDKDRNH